MRLLIVVLLAAALLSNAAGADDPKDLRLVPFPKEVRLLTGEFGLARAMVFEAPSAQAEALAALLNAELERGGFKPARVVASATSGQTWRLTAGEGPGGESNQTPGSNPGGYTLDLRQGEVVCGAGEPAGLSYGVQTLCQVIRANRRGNALPCVAIRDWPSLRWRCFQDDMTRGPSSTLETLKFEAALGAYLKLNLMTYYMEHQFAFAKYPEIAPPGGSLTPADLSALVTHAKSLQVDVLGNQQSFGHFGNILKYPRFASLRETEGVLTPVREETYQLLDDLYSEVCPLLPFPWFNVCCDETEGLGTGPARELASQIGVGGVYVRHIRRVHDLLKEHHGKRMMMWGDIILQHPLELDQVPKDTIMLTWAYDPRASFEGQIVPFAKSGYEFFVCPGVNNWNRILPDFSGAAVNIQNFIRDGVKHGALGMINTDWEDDGEAINAVKWHADAWAAECAWNASATRLDDFNRRIGAVLFGEPGDQFGRAVDLLSRTHRMPAMKGMLNSRFWDRDFLPQGKPAAIRSAASNLLAVLHPAIRSLEECRQEARCNQHVVDAFLFGARRTELIGQRMLDGLEAVQLYEKAFEAAADADTMAPVEHLIRKTRDAHQALGREFASLWLVENRPYALDWTLRRYTNVVGEYDALLDRVSAAAVEARAGRHLPAPEQIGLAMPKPLTRLLQPRQASLTPLDPQAPWADSTATHRLGLTVLAGAVDRFYLPVEVTVTTPRDLTAKAVRAFSIDAQGSPRELAAQLDALGQSGASRLVFILDQGLRKDEQVSVHVYLGLPKPPAAVPGAVQTRQDGSGKHWIENDRIRALLGEEGAHIYRWEVKGAANRDLTMPGDNGWAGFSDVATHRPSQYRLECLGRGPAMVEFRCEDAVGDEKRIRVYAHASWMEVLLSDPTPVYWDFDNALNFAADGPTPGTWLFSNGESGPVGRDADGVSAQVTARNTSWSVKFNGDKLALGLITPETAAFHRIGPGAGAGGVGIENSPPVQHFVTFAGQLELSPAETMNQLQSALDLNRPASVSVYGLQAR